MYLSTFRAKPVYDWHVKTASEFESGTPDPTLPRYGTDPVQDHSRLLRRGCPEPALIPETGESRV
jgi:hypothetical protein